MRPRSFVALLCFVFTLAAHARVISYSPYSDKVSYPATQSRTNRFFAILETTPSSQFLGAPVFFSYPTGQLVFYDSTGQTEPRVIFPADNAPTAFSSVAAREENGVSTILIQTNANINNANPQRLYIWFISTDSGQTWKPVNGLGTTVVQNIARFQNDIGGRFVNARYSPILIGTKTFPFIVQSGSTINLVGFDGSVKTIFNGTVGSPVSTPQLLGTDVTGSRVLFRKLQTATLSTVDQDGIVADIGTNVAGNADGWITPDGDAYVTEQSGSGLSVSRFHSGSRVVIATTVNSSDPIGIFAVPTIDYSAAWIVQRGSGHPTNLYLHTVASGAVQQWSDVTAPQVEALHPGASGNTLLIQVHRSRPQTDQRIFLDPALALWHVGQPAPAVYDELFMNEQPTKAFVHLDVENAVLNGDPFVFDSGAQPAGNPSLIISPAPAPPPGGGSDVIQEWGVVRASFKQKLVLPGIARVPGLFNSYWQSDVIIHNPSDAQQKVDIRYVPTGAPAGTMSTTITLEPSEIRVVKDALKTLFNQDGGGGAFFLTPESGINVTSRTYTSNDKGTFGFGMNGIDFYAGAASARFPVTFAGAFPGLNFRTNVVLTDVGGRGADTAINAISFLGAIGTVNLPFSVDPNSQMQYNSISTSLGLLSTDTAALVVQPTRGEAIASVISIDNRTNDPTYFPPDLPSPIVRTIPVIGHVDGVNNSRFRSDLYLYNPSTTARTVTLQMKAWDSNDTQTISFTMLPSEARVIPDVMLRLFNRSGIARLRYQSSGDSNGVRVTSRTYSIDDNGGTYGFLMPPLNNFQSAVSGDSLEILGVVGGKQYRTNVGLVDLTAFPSSQPASARIEIIDDKGKTIDQFTVPVPSAGGVQINDIFHSRNLGDGPAAALIRVSPLSGLIGAYATMNDNGTNDPTYLAANLAARQ